MALKTKKNTGKGTPPKPTSYKRMATLIPEHRAMIDAMFFRKEPISEIVRTCQEDLDIFKDVTTAALSKFFFRYKWDVIDKQIVLNEQSMSEGRQLKALSNIAEDLDVLMELRTLVELQRTRLGKLATREASMPVLMASMGNEIKTMAGLVGQYAELAMDLGAIVRRSSKTNTTNNVAVFQSLGRAHVNEEQGRSKQLTTLAGEFISLLENGDVPS